MQIEQANKQAADLHWLAFLLTGSSESSIDIAVEAIASQDVANPYFSTWMVAWSRRVVIAKALAAVRDELAASARRTEWSAMKKPAMPREWALDPATTKAEIEKALHAIDVFPRAALLLLVFEGVPIADVMVLLDADKELVRKAQAIGLRELTRNLARMQGWTSAAATPYVTQSEEQHV